MLLCRQQIFDLHELTCPLCRVEKRRLLSNNANVADMVVCPEGRSCPACPGRRSGAGSHGRLCKEKWPEVVRVHVQLMSVIENVMPKFITIEEVDGFLFHHMSMDKKAGEGAKEKVSYRNLS